MNLSEEEVVEVEADCNEHGREKGEEEAGNEERKNPGGWMRVARRGEK